jgi:Kdo2-lipid IVA lauroyltransferase/acyltransferase
LHFLPHVVSKRAVSVGSECSILENVARNKSALTIAAEYYPLRAFVTLLQTLPYDVSRRLSRLVVRTLLRVLPKRRLIESQIAAAFPELSATDHEDIARRSIDNIAEGLSAFAYMPKMDRAEMESRVTLEGAEHMEDAFRQGRGMITFTAHYGSWELMANYVTRRYPRVAMLVRPLDNARLEALVHDIRACGGGGVIDSHRAFKDGIRLLRSNGVLGLLMDQNFYKGGVFVNFFGRLAATTTIAPILARRTGCALLPMHNVQKDGKVRIICEPPVALSENPDLNQAIREDVQRLTAIIEGWIRTDPGQWLWLHNRWKRQPTPEEQHELAVASKT